MTKIIATHGGYKNLKSFQTAQIAFDLNFQFCDRYVSSLKMRDQMEGAGRSGVQNIGEGSRTSGTSKQSELRLVNVARASLDELKLDYEDFLRQRDLPIWKKDDKRVLEIRNVAYASNKSYTTYMSYMSNPETAANCILCILNQANYLLDQQMKALEADLKSNGDYKERYNTVRKEKLMGEDKDEYEDILKKAGVKRLPNGQIVKLEDDKTKQN